MKKEQGSALFRMKRVPELNGAESNCTAASTDVPLLLVSNGADNLIR